MYKPDSLRKHLSSAIPALKKNPERFHVFADQGHLVATGTGSFSFEYQYRLNLIMTDYSGDPDAMMVPLLSWVAVHQVELLANPEKRQAGLRFEVDFNNNKTVDISLELDLTEKVIVTQDDKGRLSARHQPEPQLTPGYTDTFWQLYKGDDLLAEWSAGDPKKP